jgi:hypothetical protein
MREETMPQIRAEEKTSLTTQQHKINNNRNKHQQLKDPLTMGVEEPHLDKKANNALTAVKQHTKQPNAGAVERNLSMKKKTTRSKTKQRKDHLSTQSTNLSSTQKTKYWFLQSTRRESPNNNQSK